MKKLFFIPLLCLIGMVSVEAQQKDRLKPVEIDGQILTQLITPEGDTILLATLDDVTLTSPRSFESREDYLKYMKYRRYAVVVFPYAREAIRIFRETERATQELNKRKSKRYIRQLQKELKEEFEDKLKQLTRTQGYILVKMIEKELDTPMYDLVKDLRNGLTASYWNTFSSFYGYSLKDGYIEGEDPILDTVLQDFDISYDL
jgi:hypothetical protein